MESATNAALGVLKERRQGIGKNDSGTLIPNDTRKRNAYLCQGPF